MVSKLLKLDQNRWVDWAELLLGIVLYVHRNNAT